MNDTEIVKELKKLKYHVQLLGQSIDSKHHSVEALILEMDWDEADVAKAHDIFEKYDTKIQKKEKIKWNDFELELRSAFDIGYQTVKSIIIAFHKNNQWMDVCHGYAMSFEPSTPIEFHQITRPRP